MSTPNKPGRWVLDSAQAGLPSLCYDASTSSPTAEDLGPEDVLVEMRAASLNYRDLAIARGNPQSDIPLPALPGVIPGSDGAGVVLAVGSAVTSLSPGTRVLLHMIPFFPSSSLPSMSEVCSGLGQNTNGTLCRIGIFHYSVIVDIGDNMSFEEAATLGCSGITAWNALMGMKGRAVKEGDWVLVQGTGGVSVAALQIALAAGATVIATTSSDAKASRLRALGAHYILNYRTQPEWGVEAKKLTPDERGVDHVIDIGGPTTLRESINATRLDGVITATGMVAGLKDNGPEAMSALWRLYIMRGVLLGSKDMMSDMIRWFNEKTVKPAMDDVVFGLEDAKMAYDRLEKQKHFSKVIIKID